MSASNVTIEPYERTFVVREVRLKVEFDHGAQAMAVVSSPRAEVCVAVNASPMKRADWEVFKRAVDQAFETYKAKFLVDDDGTVQS